jgi:hypothetical protein
MLFLKREAKQTIDFRFGEQKMKVFLSSTCYDLKDLRAEIEAFFKAKPGFTILLSDRPNFPVTPSKHRHDVCIENVADCDLFILVIDKRFGASYYKDKNISITWAEFNKAVESKREICAFIRTEIWTEREIYKHNLKKNISIDPFFVDDVRTYKLIDAVQSHEGGLWIQQFDNSVQLKERLQNIQSTNHSPLTGAVATKSDTTVYTTEAPSLSGSALRFLTDFTGNGSANNLQVENLEKAINIIPNSLTPVGELIADESIPGSNDYFYFMPLRHSGDDGELTFGMAPTALGRAVKSELQDQLNFLKSK